MRAAELAEELADFWFSAIAGAGWQARRAILQEIDSQLAADLEKRSDYEAVWPLFVAAVIGRLGTPPVRDEVQAKLYAVSANERHRAAANEWFAQGASSPRESDAVVHSSDRRRFPRQSIDAVSEIWVQGRPAPCRVVDLSSGGARVVVLDMEPEPGTSVALALPGSGVRDATVVFRNEGGIGLEFADRSEAA